MTGMPSDSCQAWYAVSVVAGSLEIGMLGFPLVCGLAPYDRCARHDSQAHGRRRTAAEQPLRRLEAPGPRLGFAPTADEVVGDAEQIEDPSTRVIDHVVQRGRAAVERGDRRRDDRAALGGDHERL